MNRQSLAVSVLDLIPVRRDQTSADALAASLELARTAERLGVHRYWVAEHHNMAAIASTNPPVLIAMFASVTSTMRIGSGGVMLPNHSPLVVAEQFALLEAGFPGRIDLGIGRAPGTDMVTSWALRHGAGGVGDDSVDHFDEYVAHIIALMDPGGAQLSVGGRSYALNATPSATSAPALWLLGSSDYSARLAARMGLPYVFASHFATGSTQHALDLYRREFVPSEALPRPRTFLTVNAVVASTGHDAHRLALPQILGIVALRTGQELRPQMLVEDAEGFELPELHRPLADAMRAQWLIGDAPTVAEAVRAMADRYDVDEVMVNPVAAATEGTPADRSPNREATLRLLMGSLTSDDFDSSQAMATQHTP